MKIEIFTSNGELIAELAPTPLEISWNKDRAGARDIIAGALGIPTIKIYADVAPLLRSLDRAQRALNRLRYPPKEPARGIVSRRREKLRKSGIRPR